MVPAVASIKNYGKHLVAQERNSATDSLLIICVLAAAISTLSTNAQATGPSFNCNNARTPSEIQICRNPKLSELDNVLAA